MGTILIEAFLEAKTFTPTDLYVTNRTIKKANRLASLYNGLHVCDNARTIVEKCDWIFLCVKPLQIIPIVDEVHHLLTQEKTIISITSPVFVSELAQQCNAQVVRFVPSIVNRALDGPSLVTFSETVTKINKEKLLKTFSTISRPEMIDDQIVRISSDLASCGPAFLSFFMEKYIQAAVEETKITKAEATKIIEAMLIGYGELLKKKKYSLQTLQEKVTVQGGITGEGLNVLQSEIGNLFHLLVRATHDKFAEDRLLISEQIKNKSKE